MKGDAADLRSVREYYAKLVTGRYGPSSASVLEAFARVERECFVGSGPWKIFTASGYVETPSADFAYLYQDVVVPLAEDRLINNGEPSLHALCLTSLGARPGEAAVHIGCGTGYYTAILADIVGPTGRVDAFEVEGDLASRAQVSLSDRPWVEVHAKSGAGDAFPACDIIYVNAGASDLPDAWLDALRPGGRLVVPLTPDWGLGGMFKIEPLGSEYSAAYLCPAAFFPCQGARDSQTAAALAAAFQRWEQFRVRSLRRDGDRDESCWVSGPGWWLSTTPCAAPK
ncbi:protein-L-isoaspartate(D-aspartate) O-methyltransferase [Candidatus Binatia bacterium]|jgi:protein-L-isoaspartate(D-aspartate) O-methyltransferase|nr:protein-L-isoaspartate(D-aspartate) O-methyltransferase [Candidatus Binatia bacterium]